MKINKLILASLIGCLAFGSLQLTAQEQEPYIGSAEFERLKELVGSWECEADMGNGPQVITISYRLTSGGSVIVDTIFAGSPHEMITVYHDNSKGNLTLTHYCMLGNQPKMVLKSNEMDELSFALSEDSDIDVANETHMHSVKFKFEGNDDMVQSWKNYEGGKESKVMSFAFKRVQ